MCVCEEAWPSVLTPVCTQLDSPALQGAFSRCYKLTDMSTSAVFALKVVPRGGGGAARLHARGKVLSARQCPGAPEAGPQRGPCPGVWSSPVGHECLGCGCLPGVYTWCPACRWNARSLCTAACDIAISWPSTPTSLTGTTYTWCWNTAVARCGGRVRGRHVPSHPCLLSSSVSPHPCLSLLTCFNLRPHQAHLCTSAHPKALLTHLGTS